MSKRFYMFFVLFVLVFNITLYSDGLVNIGNTKSVSINSPMNVSSLPSLNPITVNGDANFTSYGIFTGYGNSTHPYILKDYFIQAGASNGITISNTNAYFIIENIWINGSSDTGFSLNYVHNGQLINCTTTNNMQNGIYLTHSSHNRLINNTVQNSDWGIRLWIGNSFNSIINNTVSTTTYGFVTNGFQGNSDFSNVFVNNTAFNSDYGFIQTPYTYTYNISFINNLAFNNTIDGFFVQSNADTTLRNSLINNTANHNGKGFELDDSHNISVTGNNAFYNNEYGFYLTSTTLNYSLIGYISNNIAKYNGIADFYVDGTLYWSSMSDIVISRTVFNDSITWYATSSAASTYTIYSNDSEVRSGMWISGSNITYSLTDFTPNTYNITLTVQNSYGYRASLSVILTIREQQIPITETTTISTTATTTAVTTVTTTSEIPPESETTTIVETSTTIESSITTIVSQILETVSKTTEGFEIVIFCLSFLGLLLIRRKRERNK